MRVLVSRRARVLAHPRVTTLVGMVLLFAVALLVRMPYFMTVPMMTDEYREINGALDIVQNGQLPLTMFVSYLGPFWIYLNALVFGVVGPSYYVPRATVMVLGAFTVVATYFLARELAHKDWRVGLVAALLMAFNPQHILWNSHMAYSNHTTPLFTTLTLLAYFYATRRERPVFLIAAGALFAVAVQTHPLAIVLAPALLVDFFWSPKLRGWLGSPIPYLAVAAALVVYSPVLLHDAQTGFASLRDAEVHNYAFRPTLNPLELGDRAVQAGRRLAYIALGSTARPRPADFFYNGLPLCFVVLVVASLIWFTRRRDRFPLVVILVSGIGLLIVNRNYEVPVNGRYIMYLLPVVFTVWAAGLIAILDRVQGWGQTGVVGAGKGFRSRLLLKGGVVLVPAAVLGSFFVVSMMQLNRTYATATQGQQSEAPWLALVDRILEEPALPVFMVKEISGNRSGQSLRYYLRIEQRAVRILPNQKSTDFTEELKKVPAGLIVAPSSLSAKIPWLEPLGTVRSRCARNCDKAEGVALFRFGGEP